MRRTGRLVLFAAALVVAAAVKVDRPQKSSNTPKTSGRRRLQSAKTTADVKITTHTANESTTSTTLTPEIANASNSTNTTTTTASTSCQTLNTAADFNITTYIAGKWYTQMQNPQWYQTEAELRCVTATYRRLEDSCVGYGLWTYECWRSLYSIWWYGWQIDVNNEALTIRNSGSTSGFLCAKQIDGGKILVAPCFLPAISAGAPTYWVVEHNETAGYALITGGQPDLPTGDSGQCTFASPQTSGLWIFTRAKNPPASLVQHVKNLAEAHGINTSSMLPVNHTGCVSTPSWHPILGR